MSSINSRRRNRQHMQYEIKNVSIKEFINGYNKEKETTECIDKKIHLSNVYQREYFYDEGKQEKLINSIIYGYPIGPIYVFEDQEDKESCLLVDGKQRLYTILKFINGDFPIRINEKTFFYYGFSENLKEILLDYSLSVYIVQGWTDAELKTFIEKTNTAGFSYNEQEARNIMYCGPWLADAKNYFVKSPKKEQPWEKYLNGRRDRSDYLQIAIKWVSDNENLPIDKYMAMHVSDEDANQLIDDFRNIVEWVSSTFPVFRREMTGLDWGRLYKENKDKKLDPIQLEKELVELFTNPELVKFKGVYQYVLTKDEQSLDLRVFSESQKRTMYERQNKKCNSCGKEFPIEKLEAHHIVEWQDGGRTIIDNGEMLCSKCHKAEHNKRKTKIE